MKKLLSTLTAILLAVILSLTAFGCGGSKFTAVSSEKDALKAVKDETADVAVMKKAVADACLKESTYKNSLKMLDGEAFTFDKDELVFLAKKGSDVMGYVNYSLYNNKTATGFTDIVSNYNLDVPEFAQKEFPGKPAEGSVIYKAVENSEIKIGYIEEDNYAIEKENVMYLLEVQGLSYEIIEHISLSFGIERITAVRGSSLDELKTKLNNGEIDVICGNIIKTEELANDFDLSVPYAYDRQVLVVRSADTSKYTSLSSLKGASFTAKEGSSSEAFANGDLKNKIAGK